MQRMYACMYAACVLAVNRNASASHRVRSYLRVHTRTPRPLLPYFDPSLFDLSASNSLEALCAVSFLVPFASNPVCLAPG